MSTRKSPEQHASETEIGTIKKGSSGSYWIVVSVGSSKRWMEVSDKKPRVLNTMYNGETTIVVIGDTKVFCFHNDKYIISIPYEDYWIPYPFWAPPLKSPRKPGDSTILLRSKGKTYVYIDGHQILEFQIDGEVVEDYYSPMGNSWVAYPYIVTKNNIYLMLERVKLKRSPEIEQDPYEYFYNTKPASTKFATKTLYDAWKKK